MKRLKSNVNFSTWNMFKLIDRQFSEINCLKVTRYLIVSTNISNDSCPQVTGIVVLLELSLMNVNRRCLRNVTQLE